MVEINGSAKRIEVRFTNYAIETISIKRKISEGRISPGKVEKLKFRLNLIEKKLMPRIAKGLQS